jgi:hypothetical protein
MQVSDYFYRKQKITENMDRIIFINPIDAANINALSKLRNSSTFAKYIDPIDFHYSMFSALYQSGVNYFQTEEKILPISISDNSFWKKKLTDIDDKAYNKAIKKTQILLENKLHFETDNSKTQMLELETISILSNLFYSFETGIPFINTNYSLKQHLVFMKERMDKDLWNSLSLLSLMISGENIHTITPKYSILKDDFKRFEEISNSKLFSNYSDSLHELQYVEKFTSLKKEISINSYKLFSKYGGNLNMKETAFSFVKFNKVILDSFVSNIPSLVGEFVINSVEKISKDKKRISFYEIEESKYANMFCNIFDDAIKKEGHEKFKSIIDEFIESKNSR